MSDATNKTLQLLISQLPAILTAVGVIIGILVSIRNGKKTDNAATTAAVAAGHAETAATTAAVAARDASVAIAQIDDVHKVTQAIEKQNVTIADQTNGHLSRLTTANDEMRSTITTLTRVIEKLEADALKAAAARRALDPTFTEPA
jgi:SepF-like predicted cell division protein (DUF552 family)